MSDKQPPPIIIDWALSLRLANTGAAYKHFHIPLNKYTPHTQHDPPRPATTPKPRSRIVEVESAGLAFELAVRAAANSIDSEYVPLFDLDLLLKAVKL